MEGGGWKKQEFPHRGQLNQNDIMHELGVITLQIVNNH